MKAVHRSLPKGWANAAIEDLFEVMNDGRTMHQGWSPQCEKEPSPSESVWGVLKTTAIQPGLFQSEHNKQLPNALTPRPQIEVRPGDILLTCAGPRSRCGIACLVRSTRRHLMISGKMYRFRVPENLFEPRYLEAFLQTATARDAIDRMKTGGSDSGLNLTHDRFRQLKVPVAPLDEQRRIVETYEELTTDLDAGVAALERVRDKLKLYRAAVLKAAVEGALTAEWRKQHPQTESASELLKRILAERRRRWEEEQLRKFKEKGREPPASWKAKYNEPVAPDTTDLPPIPEGWCWASFEQVSMRVTVGHVGPMRDEYVETGIPFLRNQNVRENKFDPEGLLFITPEFHARLAKSTIHPGDIAVVRSGAVGVSCMIPDALHEANCADLVLIQRPVRILPHYGAYYLNSAAKMDIRRGQVGIALIHFNTKSVAALAVAVPPVAEQELIVEAVEDQLSIIDHLESDLDTKLKTAHALHQSILRHAFSGKLVPQDPNDEPAFELLKRIAAEREQRTREAAAAKRLNGHQPRRASKPRGTAARVTSKASQHGRIADR